MDEDTILVEPDSPLQARLAALLAQAEAAYLREAGGETVCTLHKDGRVSGGLKYEEGRVVALRDLQRALKRVTPDGASTTLGDELTRWEADLAHQRAAARPLPWVAYAQGGVDALQALG